MSTTSAVSSLEREVEHYQVEWPAEACPRVRRKSIEHDTTETRLSPRYGQEVKVTSTCVVATGIRVHCPVTSAHGATGQAIETTVARRCRTHGGVDAEAATCGEVAGPGRANASSGVCPV